MRILIIDDNESDRYLISRYIEKAKFFDEMKISECNTLYSSISKIENNDFDLIILDLNLPESKGIETVEKIMSTLEKNKKDIPLIILTGVEDHAIGKKAFSMGAKDFIIKDEKMAKELLRSITFATYPFSCKENRKENKKENSKIAI